MDWIWCDISHHSCRLLPQLWTEFGETSARVYPLYPVLNRDSGTTLGTSWHILAYLGILRPRCHFSKVEQCWTGGPAATHWELTEQDTPPMLCMFDKAGSTGVHSSDHSSPWISLGVPWFSIQHALKKSWWICVNCLDSGSSRWFCQLLCQILTINMSAKRLNQSITNII